ncbi:hypothetical protein DL771_007753 [Monosporascus sp. 5C6A]|nr:hypothetical protein DL771_007753 [Monosporascus sp. 5C6A]
MPAASTYHYLDEAVSFVPWAAEHPHPTGLSFPPGARLDDLASNSFSMPETPLASGGVYFDTSAGSTLGLEPSTANHHFSQVPPSAAYNTPHSSVHCFSGDGFVSPDGSGAPDANFQHYAHQIFSMGGQAAPERRAPPCLKRPWSRCQVLPPSPLPPPLFAQSPARQESPSSSPSSSPSRPAAPTTAEKPFEPAPNNSAGQANSRRRRNHAAHLRNPTRKLRNPTNKPSSLLSPTVPTPAGITLSNEDNSNEFPTTEAPEEQQLGAARHNHNVVEQHYRNRLNHEFDQLLAVLQTETQQRREEQEKDGEEGERDDDEDGYSFYYTDMPRHGGQGGEDKRVSKAEVLRIATRRIKLLERERRRLRLERRELLQNMEAAGMGGGGATRTDANLH